MNGIEVDEALLILKIAFIVLLYLFIWRIVRSASRDFRTGGGGAQESMIIAPGRSGESQAASVGPAPQTRGRTRARLVVLESPALARGEEIPVDAAPVSIGRGGQNDIPLDGDEFSSARHARFETRRDGLWVEDTGSTNGTFVNGARVTTPRRLGRGDVVRVGQTDFRVDL
ncbi:MAG: FHA domain-containing protein [Actinobacteria bacterium]|nr:FHA domain-containing protein [Actinomycetota bacterium]